LSPGDSVLAIADSHPPVPEPGKMKTCPEHLLQIFEQRQRELRKIRRAMVFQRDIHRLADAERHVGRARNGQPLEPWHELAPCECGLNQ